MLEAGVGDPGLTGLVPEASLLGVQMAVLSLCPHTAVPLCVSVSWCPLLVRTPVGLDWDPPQWPHFPFIPSLRARPQIRSHSEVLGFGHQHLNLGATVQAMEGGSQWHIKLPPCSLDGKCLPPNPSPQPLVHSQRGSERGETGARHWGRDGDTAC